MLVHRIVRTICNKRLLDPGDTVVTGISGGADSTALLHVLSGCDLGLQLIAVYIDHGLRPQEAAAEQLFTRQLADCCHVAYHSRKIAVREYQQQQKCSLEEAARILRYTALEEIRSRYQAKVIAVAHTADDQVEEFLIRMIRGSGLKGLCGMNYRNGHIIRPLLAESKESLLEYLREHQLSYCHDSSNDDRSFLRNRIRLDLLPDLENNYNPAIRTNILQTTAILSQEEALLEDMSKNLFDRLCTITQGAPHDGTPLAIEFLRDGFISTHTALQRRLLEKICWKMQSRPTFRTLMQLQQLIQDGTTGAKQHLPHGLRVRIEAERVHFSHPAGRGQLRGDGEIPLVMERLIPSIGRYTFPEIERQLTLKQVLHTEIGTVSPATLVVDGDKFSFPLVVRSTQPGEKMRPLGAPGSKKVSRILSDLKIPAHLRTYHPLVIADGEPMAILGLKIADKFKVSKESITLLSLTWEHIEAA